MQVINEHWPTDQKRIDEINSEGPEGPVYMVNLLRFYEKAQYEDGSEPDLSGLEAYSRYGLGLNNILERYNSGAVFMGMVTQHLVGKVEDPWHAIAIVRYPKRTDMLKMIDTPEWEELDKHRKAGLEGQLNIETVLLEQALNSQLVQAILNAGAGAD